MKHEIDLLRSVQFFHTISLESLARIEQIYAATAYFKDPFNEVRGITSIERIYRHMFSQVDAPRFVVTTHVLQDDQAFLTWDFLFYMKRKPGALQCVRGSTHLRFAADGLINYHRDYWDVAEELYEKLPILGGLMRMLKRAAQG